MKRKLTLERIHEDNFQRKLFEKMGIKHPLDTKSHENIVFKNNMVTNKEGTEINQNKVGDTKGL